MSTQNNTDIYTLKKGWIIDSPFYFLIFIVMHMIIKIPARVFGIITNFLTILVFLKCGLCDGISVCFMSLTLSDELCLLANLLSSVLSYLDLEAHVKPYVNLFYVSYILPFYGLMFYNISTMITVFLAIQKCCCIVFPLNFKSYFTKHRCVATVCFIYLVGIVLYIPFTATAFPFTTAFDDSTNSTRLTFAWSQEFLNNVFPVLKAINYISIPFSAEIIVLISTVILTVGLKHSAKFRDSTRSKYASSQGKNIGTIQVPRPNRIRSSQTPIQINFQRDINTGAQPLAKKEIRATLAVNVVAIFFVATNTPDVVMFLASLMDASFSAYGDYGVIYNLCLEMEDLLRVVNLSTNLFIYLKFNTKFSNTFKSLTFTIFKKMKGDS